MESSPIRSKLPDGFVRKKELTHILEAGMRKNIGMIDMAVRLLIGFVMLYIALFDNPIISSGMPKTIFGVLSLIPFVTALARI